MSVNNADLLEQFAVETQQHLDAIEPILFLPDGEGPDAAAVAALFRGFHSLKGLARVLGLRGLETLAHHAESLLAEVRNGHLAFTPAIRELLLESLDGIRILREHGIVSGTDAPAPQALLEALDAALPVAARGADARVPAPDRPDGALHDAVWSMTGAAVFCCACGRISSCRSAMCRRGAGSCAP